MLLTSCSLTCGGNLVPDHREVTTVAAHSSSASPAPAPAPVGDVGDTYAVGPAGPWQWMGLPGSQCANGSATGIGVSVVPNSNLLMIFLQGGGRCDSADSCSAGAATATNLQGFNIGDFNNAIAAQTGIFNRSDTTNPLAQASMVFVPYCTGDDHSGDNKASYGTQHRGYVNMGLALQIVVPMFPNLTQVLLTGSSAGGSGAFWNYYRTQQAFGSKIQVTLLDDAGPFIGQPVVEFTDASVTEWGLAKTVPQGCTHCLPGNAPAGVQNFYPFFVSAMPNHRGALLTSNEDAHVSARDNLSGPQFADALNDLADAVSTSDPAFKFFYVPSTQHTWLGGVRGSLSGVKGQDGTQLNTFVQQMLSNDPAWTDVR